MSYEAAGLWFPAKATANSAKAAEESLRRIEKKLDKIIELMSKKQSSKK